MLTVFVRASGRRCRVLVVSREGRKNTSYEILGGYKGTTSTGLWGLGLGTQTPNQIVNATSQPVSRVKVPEPEVKTSYWPASHLATIASTSSSIMDE